jgi:hypothetical protein
MSFFWSFVIINAPSVTQKRQTMLIDLIIFSVSPADNSSLLSPLYLFTENGICQVCALQFDMTRSATRI